MSKEDVVNHPSHYADTCSLECIQVMKLFFGEKAVIQFCLCNCFKYMWRYKHKNGQEDLKKARWYLNTAYDMKVYFSAEQANEIYPRIKELLDELEGGEDFESK